MKNNKSLRSSNQKIIDNLLDNILTGLYNNPEYNIPDFDTDEELQEYIINNIFNDYEFNKGLREYITIMKVNT